MDAFTDFLSAIGTSASDLLLSFFGGSVPSDAKRDGTKRRVKREDAHRAAVAAHYAATPGHPPTRQVLRAEQRTDAKQATFIHPARRTRGTNWTWREVVRALRAVEAA